MIMKTEMVDIGTDIATGIVTRKGMTRVHRDEVTKTVCVIEGRIETQTGTGIGTETLSATVIMIGGIEIDDDNDIYLSVVSRPSM